MEGGRDRESERRTEGEQDREKERVGRRMTINRIMRQEPFQRGTSIQTAYAMSMSSSRKSPPQSLCPSHVKPASLLSTPLPAERVRDSKRGLYFS